MERIASFLLFALLLNSCNFSEDRTGIRKIESDITAWHNTKINLPDSLLLLNKGEIDKIDLKEYVEKDIRILSFISNECQKCTISQIIFWDSFLNNYKNAHRIQLILIYSGINDYFTNVLMDDIGIRIPVLLDEASSALNSYALFDNPAYQTILLDDENRIQIIGDFSNNKDLEKLYLEEIEKRIVNNSHLE